MLNCLVFTDESRTMPTDGRTAETEKPANDADLSARLFAGLAKRGYRFEGCTAEKAIFHLIDDQTARIIELETRGHRPDGRRLEVVR